MQNRDPIPSQTPAQKSSGMRAMRITGCNLCCFPPWKEEHWQRFPWKSLPQCWMQLQHSLSFPNFTCTYTWANRLHNLRHYFLLESDPFLQIQQVDSSSNLPGPNKGKEYSQVRLVSSFIHSCSRPQVLTSGTFSVTGKMLNNWHSINKKFLFLDPE